MADLYRSRVTWSGVITGTGVSTFYTDAIPNTAGIKAFFTALKSYFNPGITWTILGAGDKIDDTNGDLTGAWSTGSNLTETSSSSSGACVLASGVQAIWHSTTILDSHRIQGRTYMVPVALDQYFGTTLLNSLKTSVETAGAALISSQAGHLAIWHRPKYGARPPGGGSRPLVRNGGTALVTGCTSTTKPVVLTSRRD